MKGRAARTPAALPAVIQHLIEPSRTRECRLWRRRGLSSCQSGSQDLSDFALCRPEGVDPAPGELAFDRFTCERVVHARCGCNESLARSAQFDIISRVCHFC
jgi:hypothetical protein